MLISAGVDYKNTPIELREELSFDDGAVVNTIKEICKLRGVKECVLLSICNCTEIYICADEDMVHTVVDKALDMVFGGLKSVITPEAVKECHKKIKDRSRL